MTQFFGMKRLEKTTDWIAVVSEANWKPAHSAFELAHCWHDARGFPPKVAQVIATSESLPLRRLKPIHCIVEKPVFLDTDKGPSWTDVMVYCRNEQDETVIIAVEGKAKEPFSQVLADWIRGRRDARTPSDPKPSRMQRLRYLSAVLNMPANPDASLRYQLLHRTVSAVNEAHLHSAIAAMMLVHSFGDAFEQNWLDYKAFLESIGIGDPRKDVVLGPVLLGTSQDMPTFFTWVSDEPTPRAG